MKTIAIRASLNDNYVYLFQGRAGLWSVVDPGTAEVVCAFLSEQKALGNCAELGFILNTHHHLDHVGGNEELKRLTGAQIFCSSYDFQRVPSADRGLLDGERFFLDGLEFLALAIAGHTQGHMAFVCRELGCVFVGDTLFGGGCGRLFEGSPEQMMASLERLKRETAECRIYCGHEYTENNLYFALNLEPNSQTLRAELERVKNLRAQGQPTVPLSWARELLVNPFLRAGDQAFKEALGMQNKSELEFWRELRARRNHFVRV